MVLGRKSGSAEGRSFCSFRHSCGVWCSFCQGTRGHVANVLRKNVALVKQKLCQAVVEKTSQRNFGSGYLKQNDISRKTTCNTRNQIISRSHPRDAAPNESLGYFSFVSFVQIEPGIPFGMSQRLKQFHCLYVFHLCFSCALNLDNKKQARINNFGAWHVLKIVIGKVLIEPFSRTLQWASAHLQSHACREFHVCKLPSASG